MSDQPPLRSRLLGTGARGAWRVTRATGVDSAVEALAEEAILRAIESEVTERVWARVLASDETQGLIERIAEAPEIRAAIAVQGIGFLDDLADEVSQRAARADHAAERAVRRLLRRPRRQAPAGEAGLVSRAIALVLDAAILNAGFLAVSAMIALVASLFVDSASAPPVIAAGTGVWLLAWSAYLVSFWALAGQTPGMCFLRIRIDAAGERRLGGRRAIRRLLGAALSAAALGLGFVAVLFDERRRGWLDRIAGTAVVYAAHPAGGREPRRDPGGA